MIVTSLPVFETVDARAEYRSAKLRAVGRGTAGCWEQPGQDDLIGDVPHFPVEVLTRPTKQFEGVRIGETRPAAPICTKKPSAIAFRPIQGRTVRAERVAFDRMPFHVGCEAVEHGGYVPTAKRLVHVPCERHCTLHTAHCTLSFFRSWSRRTQFAACALPRRESQGPMGASNPSTVSLVADGSEELLPDRLQSG